MFNYTLFVSLLLFARIILLTTLTLSVKVITLTETKWLKSTQEKYYVVHSIFSMKCDQSLYVMVSECYRRRRKLGKEEEWASVVGHVIFVSKGHWGIHVYAIEKNTN